MSSALVALTVMRREGTRVTLRCRDLHDPNSMSVTRSFVVLVFTIGSPDGETTRGLSSAARANGLAEPPTPEEAAEAFAPWIDAVVRTTRLVSHAAPLASTQEETMALLRERAADPALTWESLHALPNRRREDLLAEVCGHYVLEVELANEALASEVEVGWVFDTYAHDAWWQDPTNPLATDAQRDEWSVAAASFRRAREMTEERVSAWLTQAEEKGWLDVRSGGRARVLESMLVHLNEAIEDDQPPDDVAESLAELLFDHTDIDEVYASDDELRATLLRVVLN